MLPSLCLHGSRGQWRSLSPSTGAIGVGGHPSPSICFASRPGVPKLHSHSRPHVLEITLCARPCDDFSWLVLPYGNSTAPSAHHPLSLRAGRGRRPRVSHPHLPRPPERPTVSTASIVLLQGLWLVGPPQAQASCHLHTAPLGGLRPAPAWRSVQRAPRERCVCTGPSEAWPGGPIPMVGRTTAPQRHPRTSRPQESVAP